ncbi:MAG: LysR family transcriptional regulator [Acetobacterales bacterium]
MDRLAAMEVFVRVAEEGSFSAAARHLGLSNTAVSKQVKALEGRLGARLLNRTTRRVALTEVGRAYLERARRILAEVEETEHAAGRQHAEPRGTLRLNAPLSFGSLHVATAIPDFLAQYPDMEVEMTMTDRFVDVVEEGYDLAIRGRTMPVESSLIARRIAPERFAVCAAPAYLAAQGRPAAPADLAAHDCLAYAGTGNWRFAGPDGEVTVPVHGRLRANNGDALRAATLGGLGVALLPTFLVGDDLRQGRLERLLPGWEPPEAGIFAIYPHTRFLSAKVRAFIDFLVRRFNPTPEWDRTAPRRKARRSAA